MIILSSISTVLLECLDRQPLSFLVLCVCICVCVHVLHQSGRNMTVHNQADSSSKSWRSALTAPISSPFPSFPPLHTEQERMIWLLCFLFKWKYYYIMPCFIYLEMESHRNPLSTIALSFSLCKCFAFLGGSLTLEEWGLINLLHFVFHLSIF